MHILHVHGPVCRISLILLSKMFSFKKGSYKMMKVHFVEKKLSSDKQACSSCWQRRAEKLEKQGMTV